MRRIEYPVRCVIIDAAGARLEGGFTAATPEKSRPHIGKRGIAKLIDELHVEITLDDGNILYGYECWWIPEDEYDAIRQEND